MKLQSPKFLLPSLLVMAPLGALAQTPIFSWETGPEGWTANAPNAVATSTIGATDGSQSLAITQPMSEMWYSVPTSFNPSAAELQTMFTDATELKLDVSFPDPGFNSWVSGASVSVIMQGANLGWTELPGKSVPVGGSPQTVTWHLSKAQAYAMATSGWGQVLLKFTYGNGGTATGATEVVFYVDNFSHTVVPDPIPIADLFWKGDSDNLWTSSNWTTDEAGTVLGGTPDGLSTIAFGATDATNLTNLLGADQAVKGILVTEGAGFVSVGGTHDLTIGADGIYIPAGSSALSLDTTGTVNLGADQTWVTKSTTEQISVDSVIAGSGMLTKTGPGSIYLGNANTYTGGTKIYLGTIVLGNDDALGGAGAALSMESGGLDLNGSSPILGILDGNDGGTIFNSSAIPSVLTINNDLDTAYTCAINDGSGGGGVSLLKQGAGSVTVNSRCGFSGTLTIDGGTYVANSSSFGAPNLSSLGAGQIAGRQVVANSPGEISLSATYVLGNASTNTSLLPEIVLNETTMKTLRFNVIGDITLNGAILDQNSTDTGANVGYQFAGSVAVTGEFSSVIGSIGAGNHLAANTVFDVEDVSLDSTEDLYVSSPLINQSQEFGASAPGGLTKTGAGTMWIASDCTYTGTTEVAEGTLAIEFPFLSDTGSVIVASGATLDLQFVETDTVGSLVLGGVAQTEPGTYGAVGSGADFESPLITGDGLLRLEAIAADPYADWAGNYPSLSGVDAERGSDPDGDGLSNIVEFAFNSAPNNANSAGWFHSAVATVGVNEALVFTLPVRDGAAFSGETPAVATLVSEGIEYQISGSNDLSVYDQAVSEVIPAHTSGLPMLDEGWSYRSFRLNGSVGGSSPRGPKGFLRAAVVDTSAP